MQTELNNNIKLPIEEAAKIQEALKPLGYMIEGYRSRDCSSHGIILYLGHLPNNYLNDSVPNDI